MNRQFNLSGVLLVAFGSTFLAPIWLRADIEIVLQNGFIEHYKDRATIEVKLRRRSSP